MNKIRVFIVDDSSDAVSDVKKYFSDCGDIEVVLSANDGVEAVKIIEERAHDFDVLIMDLIIPKLDGLSVLETIRKKGINIKSIVTTNINSTLVINKCMDEGVNYFMLKPYDMASLYLRVREVYKTGSKELFLDDKSLNGAITDMLHSLGIPSHIKGYSYIRDSISLMYKNPSMIGAITKELYPEVASMYDTTSSRVERAIRHAIEVSWSRGDYDLMESLFGHSVDYDRAKPTNSEFIATLADRLRLDNCF